MENSEKTSRCVCKRIFCSIFPTSQSNHHSHQKLDCLPELKSTHLSEKEKQKQNAEKNKPKFEPPVKAVTRERLQYAASDVEQYLEKQGNRSNSDINQGFSDYINHAKTKIRAVSNVGGDGGEIVPQGDEVSGAEKKADVDDVFSEYINRAKLKIRKTSSIGSKKMISFRNRE